jgi:beta-glucosidase
MTPNDRFLWGASTGAHQIEGGNTTSDWWMREHGHLPGAPVDEPSGDAADSYHRYPIDMGLLATAGLNSYRFSIEWARIQPERGITSRAQIDHYRRMIDTAHDHGLEPSITLHHITNPAWFSADGGWHAPDAATLFTRYVEALTPLLGEVRMVCTINEPNVVSGLAAPGATFARLGLPDPIPEVSATLIEAHLRSCEIIRAAGADSGWSVAAHALHPEPGTEQAATDYAWPREDIFLQAGKDDDWIGVQSYTRLLYGPQGPVPADEDCERTQLGWEFYPASVGHAIRNAASRAPKVPIYVTENGIATTDDTRRIAYLRGAVAAVQDCIDDGIDVRGYFHFSALDSYEWGTYTPTFGLIAWDPATFERQPKPSLAWLGEHARSSENPTS